MIKKIPVFFLSSEAFSKKMCVAITSLLANRGANTFYNIYVLVERIYDPEALKCFEELFDRYEMFNLEFIEMKDAFNDTVVNAAGVGKETMYRLMAPEILSKVDKCIYLDSDTIVLADLSDMYDFELGDNYIAGIHPYRILEKMKISYMRAYGINYKEKMREAMGVRDYGNYIGCGVTVMNFAKMRKDNICQAFRDHCKPNSVPKDQDIINTCCYGKTLKLPVKYCIDLHELAELEWFGDYMPEMLTEIEFAMAHPVVIHFADRFKPWAMVGLPYEKDWWKYAREAGVQEELWIELANKIYDNEAAVCMAGQHAEIDSFCSGISYKVGRVITWLPRQIYYFFKRRKNGTVSLSDE